MLKKILIILLSCLLLFLVVKDYFLKAGISYYLSKELDATVKINKAKLLLSGISLEDFSLSRDKLDISLGKLRLTVNVFKQSIDDLEIAQGSLQFRDSSIDLALKKSKDDLYLLDIANLKFKDQEIKNISIPLAIAIGKISFNRIDTDFLGSAAQVKGVLNYQDLNRICLDLSLSNSSFKNLFDFLGKKEDFDFEGNFSGKLKLCFGKGKILDIAGDFTNSSGGVLNIKKETSLGFLQQYLDKASHDALVDNFKHYTYNKGRVKLSKEKDLIALHLDFGSEELGRRNILVNLHNILGGDNEENRNSPDGFINY